MLDREGRNVSHKILVVDDEEPVRKSLTMLLSAYGYEVATAADGEDRGRGEEGGSVLQAGEDLRVDHPQIARKRRLHPAPAVDHHGRGEAFALDQPEAPADKAVKDEPAEKKKTECENIDARHEIRPSVDAFFRRAQGLGERPRTRQPCCVGSAGALQAAIFENSPHPPLQFV